MVAVVAVVAVVIKNKTQNIKALGLLFPKRLNPTKVKHNENSIYLYRTRFAKSRYGA